ncbi:hypothetical protein ACIHDR_14575 [Nocardia sp. NPDC052278]|uniref:hypothetical protein n=1 Tax=unclassified Nocardia TaxID=2637762 RepID=UPI00369D8CA0
MIDSQRSLADYEIAERPGSASTGAVPARASDNFRLATQLFSIGRLMSVSVSERNSRSRRSVVVIAAAALTLTAASACSSVVDHFNGPYDPRTAKVGDCFDGKLWHKPK